MAKRSQKQKTAAANRTVRELRGEHQTGLRRVMGTVIQDGTAYGGPSLVMELQKANMMPGGAMPWDVAVGAVVQFLGDVRWLGPMSDIGREVFGGHVGGRLGQMATMRSLKIRYIDGTFIGYDGNPIATAPAEGG